VNPIVDVDDCESWPPSIREDVALWARRLAGSTEYVSDLEIPIELEPAFRKKFSGYLLRAYHCTRLLAHERQDVCSEGLRRLTVDLVAQRIDAAEKFQEISPEMAVLLRRENVFATGNAQYRKNQVCLVISAEPLHSDVTAFGDLLLKWGGEAIFKVANQEARAALTRLGIPTVIAVSIDISEPAAGHLTFPSLHKVFVGKKLDLKRSWADVFYKSDIPRAHIEQVAQPGDSFYALFPNLPQR
jgi:hypothetical protein